MCSIAGYAGSKPAAPFIYEALCRMEYRGYDSYGMAVEDGGKLDSLRRLGAPSEDCILDIGPDSWGKGTIGVGHTRWSSHGKPSIENCHPILGSRTSDPRARECYVVHNGIIDNHLELKAQLTAEGYGFDTETDTESLAHLLSFFIPTNTQSISLLIDAIRLALAQVKGQYAFACLHRHWSKTCLIAAANGSPLCVTPSGFVASDPTAFVGYDTTYVRLPDGHLALIWNGEGAGNPDFVNGLGELYIPVFNLAVPEPQPDEQEKGGYGHWMLKEIMEQPAALAASPSILGPHFANRPSQIVLFGCGSSYNACLLARSVFEQWAGIQTTVEYASEFRARNLSLYPRDAVFIGVTQSGETKDTLLAMDHVGLRPLVAVTNVAHSTAAAMCHRTILIGAGEERGVAATKTFTSTLSALLSAAAAVAPTWGNTGTAATLIRNQLPALTEQLLTQEFLDRVRDLAEDVTRHDNVLFLGRGLDYAVAREGALKLKEVAGIHADAMPAAEMKHGPIALVDEETFAVVIATDDGEEGKIASNVSELQARGATVLVIVEEGRVSPGGDLQIEVPASGPVLRPFLATVVLQLLAYYAAIRLGRNPDRPKSLAKCVSV